MRDAARTLASYGRNGDDMLLHVSRKELEGIRSLTGRNFTRNPDTGLPEAFNFASLIPVAAGVVGTVVGGPLAGAAAAAAASAGTAAAQGATTEEALTQGLISGVTSYAGGQIIGELGASGAGLIGGADAAGSVIGSAGTEAGVQAGTEAAIQAGQQTAAQAGQQAAMQAAAAPAATQAAVPAATGAVVPAAAGAAPGVPATAGATPALAGVPDASLPLPPQFVPPTDAQVYQMAGAAERAQMVGAGLSDPQSVFNVVSQNPAAAATYGLGTYGQLSGMMNTPGVSAPQEEQYDPNRYPERFPEVPRTWSAPPAGYSPGFQPEYRYFAEGGLATLRSGDSYTQNLMNEAKAALLGEHPRPREAIERFREAFGSDALDVLRDRISAGRVRGSGGGLDDLVPGSIEGRQRVRLADGEFVIPSDVVSGLGDGSTDQGVRRLHGLMNKVRQQRTGKRTQPKAIGGKITL